MFPDASAKASALSIAERLDRLLADWRADGAPDLGGVGMVADVARIFRRQITMAEVHEKEPLDIN